VALGKLAGIKARTLMRNSFCGQSPRERRWRYKGVRRRESRGNRNQTEWRRRKKLEDKKRKTEWRV